MTFNWKDLVGVLFMAVGVLISLADIKTIGGLAVLVGIGFLGWRIRDFMRTGTSSGSTTTNATTSKASDLDIDVDATKKFHRNGNGNGRQHD